MRPFKALFIILLIYSVPLIGSSREELICELFASGVTVDLREPTYIEGVIKTEQGGVITSPNMRIQGMNITYTRKIIDGLPVLNVVVEGDILLEYYNYVFVGERLEYDFQTKTGVMINGRSAIEPWFFGGERIDLLADGTYVIINGYITTSENLDNEWQIKVENAVISDDQFLRAKNIQLRLGNIPVLWLPCFNANLNYIFDTPLKWRVRWGGSQGPRVGFIYEIFTWKEFKVLLRLDYRLTRGLGGGIETAYETPDNHERFYTSNYVARDSSIEDPDEQIRFRFAGIYDNRINDDKFRISLTYDKLSDRDMETDYYDKGLELKTALRTQLNIHHQMDETWITNFYTRVRLNYFQTVKQELPTLYETFHPFELGSSGIMAENRLKIGYLDFKYANGLKNVFDYNSTRSEFRNRLYRPFYIGPLTSTPHVGIVGIHYGNSPGGASEWLALGTLGCEVNTHVSRLFGHLKHSIEPYAQYNYYTYPTVKPTEIYIFDINDGWYHLNMLRFGCRNLIYRKNTDGFVSRYLYTDLYAYSFFNTPTLRQSIPKIYGKIVWDIFSNLRYTVTTAWDLERNYINHINVRADYTFDENLAFATEYRHRSPFAWRKADETNFVLDSFRTETQLRVSAVSDRRDTFLFHTFYRFHPNWAIELESRTGWNRMRERSYNEYEVDLLTTLGRAWHFKFSYQHRENDNRIAVYINVGVRPPQKCNIYCE
jgi:hypothetical protein